MAQETETRVAEQPDQILDEQPDEILGQAVDVGRERLGRTPLDIVITAVIGGVEVSLGCLASAAVVGAVLSAAPGVGLFGAPAIGGVVFPIGFLFVVLGRSELFTENFLIPVVAVLNGERRPRELVELWALSWLGNILGCVAMAALVSIPDAVGDPIHVGLRDYAAYKLGVPPSAPSSPPLSRGSR